MSTPVPSPSPSFWARLVAAVRHVLALEPAYVSAVWRAVVVLLGSVGIAVTDTVDARVAGAILAVYALVEILTSRSTHGKVVPTAKLPDPIVREAAAGPLPGSPASTVEYSPEQPRASGGPFPPSSSGSSTSPYPPA